MILSSGCYLLMLKGPARHRRVVAIFRVDEEPRERSQIFVALTINIALIPSHIVVKNAGAVLKGLLTLYLGSPSFHGFQPKTSRDGTFSP